MSYFAFFRMLNRLILQFCDYRQFLGNKNTALCAYKNIKKYKGYYFALSLRSFDAGINMAYQSKLYNPS